MVNLLVVTKVLKMTINADSLFKADSYLELHGEITHRVFLGDDAHGNITRLDNMVNGFGEKLEHYQHEFESVKVQLDKAKKEVNKPFDRALELKQKTARLNELNHKLAMDEKDETRDIGDEDDIPDGKSINPFGLER